MRKTQTTPEVEVTAVYYPPFDAVTELEWPAKFGAATCLDLRRNQGS